MAMKIYAAPQHGRIHYVDMQAEPHENLARQTAIIAGAKGFVGTYGGFAYLAPFCGINAVAFYSDRTYFVYHLELAQRAHPAQRWEIGVHRQVFEFRQLRERAQVGPAILDPQMHVLELRAVGESAVVFEDRVLQPEALQLRQMPRQIPPPTLKHLQRMLPLLLRHQNSQPPQPRLLNLLQRLLLTRQRSLLTLLQSLLSQPRSR